MGRRARSAPKPAATASPSAFAGLRGLIARAPDHGQDDRPARTGANGNASVPQAAPVGPAAPSAADRALFRSSVGPVCTLRSNDRIEIERPRPAPLRRPRTAEDAGEESPSTASAPADPLRAAYEGVMPLRAHGRADLGASRRALPGPTGANRGTQANAPILPADADRHDAGALFLQVVGDTRPLRAGNRVELAPQSPLPLPLKRNADERSALDESLSIPPTFEDRLDMGDEAAFLRSGLPRRILTDLRRGRWVLQGEIDLHGFNRDEARAALAACLRDSLLRGKRCIRVIHGKGLGSPGRVSILKQLSRGWLAQREEILAFCQAGPRDGGEGALLVLMRAQNAPPA